MIALMGLRLAGALRIGALCAGVAVLTGCAGGLPELPSMPSMPSLPSLSALADEAPNPEENTEKVKAEQKPVDLAELASTGPLGDKSIGKANAPVTIIEYASLTCPVCAKFHSETLPQIKKAYVDKGKVRYVIREFPIGRSAAAAAIAVRCAPEKDYFRLYEKFLATQKDWVAQEVKRDEIYNVVKTSGLKRDKFDACFANQAINDGLVPVKERGRKLGVAGTPTFFVNGKRVPGGVTFEEMKVHIDEALGQTPASPQAKQPQQPKPQQQAAKAA